MKELNNVALSKLITAFTSVPFNKMLGLELNELSHDQVSMRFEMKESLIGNFLQGILHGGVISSVLDMAGGLMVMATSVHKNPHCTVEQLADIVGKCSTIDLQVSYLRPGKGDHFFAKSWLVKSGSNITFTRMELVNQDHTLLAIANGTYKN